MHYLVTAYRYGDLSGYSYPVGVFATLDQALAAAHDYRESRGGKYDHTIHEIEAGKSYDAEEAQVVAGTGSLADRP